MSPVGLAATQEPCTSDALENRSNNFAAIVADVAVNMDALTVQTPTSVQGSLADHELKLIRRACESVLALLDVYEA